MFSLSIFCSSLLVLNLNANGPIGEDCGWDNPLRVARSDTSFPYKRNIKPEVFVVWLQNKKHGPTYFHICVRIQFSLVCFTIFVLFYVRFLLTAVQTTETTDSRTNNFKGRQASAQVCSFTFYSEEYKPEAWSCTTQLDSALGD